MFLKIVLFVAATHVGLFAAAALYFEAVRSTLLSERPLSVVAVSMVCLALCYAVSRRFERNSLVGRRSVGNGRKIRQGAMSAQADAVSSAPLIRSAASSTLDSTTAAGDQQRGVMNLLESLPVAWLSFDGTGRLRTCNEQARRLLHLPGKAPDKSSPVASAKPGLSGDGKNSVEQVLVLMGIASGDTAAILTEKKARFEGRSAHGLRLWCTWMQLSANTQGHCAAGLLVFDDVTGLCPLQGTNDELVNYLRHDFRAPLASITAVLDQLMREQQTPPADQRQAMQQMRGLVDRALDLSEQMLLLSRAGEQEALRRKSLSFAEVVDQACSDVQLKHQSKALQVELDLDVDAMVLGDYSLLYRAALNLVDNAMRVSPRGSTVHVRLVVHGKHAILNVRDQGPGLSTTEPCRVTNAAGFGLGLRLVRRVAASHQGRFFLGNSPLGGASALLVLPQHEPASEKPLRLELASPRPAGFSWVRSSSDDTPPQRAAA
jgi:nitrogen fixation/metabolism regulation signal transduction histidine kinase